MVKSKITLAITVLFSALNTSMTIGDEVVSSAVQKKSESEIDKNSFFNTNTSGTTESKDINASTENTQTTNTTTIDLNKLQGKVEKINLDLEMIRDVGLDLKTASRASMNLFQEVTVQPVRVITQPEPLANGTIINIPVGTEPTGPPRPARREQVNAYIKSMKSIIDMLKMNVDEFIAGERQFNLPENVMTELQPKFQLWIKIVNATAYKFRQLEQITYAPPYNNEEIAVASLTIAKDIKYLDQIRMQIYQVVKRYDKRKIPIGKAIKD